MNRIGIMGAPCTGKTTLARALTVHLMDKHHKVTEYIDEYARQFIWQYGIPTVADQYFFFDIQLQKEDAVSEKTEYVICDSPIYLAYIYLNLIVDYKNPKDKFYLNSLHRKLLPLMQDRYDYVFYLPSDGGIIDDGMRFHVTTDEQIKIDSKVKGFLDFYRIEYISLKGTLDVKIAEICRHLGFDDTSGNQADSKKSQK